mgnify:CR=1 FL=1
MYKIILAQHDWILNIHWTRFVHWIIIVPEGGLYLNPNFPSRCFVIEVFLEYPSRLPLPVFSLANAAWPPSPTMSHPSSRHMLCRKPIDVVQGLRMGLFRNTAPSLVLIVLKHQWCHCRTSWGGLSEQSSFSSSALVESCKRNHWSSSQKYMGFSNLVTT